MADLRNRGTWITDPDKYDAWLEEKRLYDAEQKRIEEEADRVEAERVEAEEKVSADLDMSKIDIRSESVEAGFEGGGDASDKKRKTK